MFTDLKIMCEGTEFKVHKIVLSSQSEFFRATCSSGFLVRKVSVSSIRKLIILQESSTNAINLTEDGLNLVSRMIDCLYRGTYNDFDATADGQSWKSASQLHAAMYALGDKYDMAVLKETALSKYKTHASNTGAQDLLGFLESIAIVYSSTPESERTLRDAATEKIKMNPTRFLKDDVKAAFQKVVMEVPEFSWDLHQHWMTWIEPLPATGTKLPGSGSKRRRLV